MSKWVRGSGKLVDRLPCATQRRRTNVHDLTMRRHSCSEVVDSWEYVLRLAQWTKTMPGIDLLFRENNHDRSSMLSRSINCRVHSIIVHLNRRLSGTKRIVRQVRCLSNVQVNMTRNECLNCHSRAYVNVISHVWCRIEAENEEYHSFFIFLPDGKRDLVFSCAPLFTLLALRWSDLKHHHRNDLSLATSRQRPKWLISLLHWICFSVVKVKKTKWQPIEHESQTCSTRSCIIRKIQHHRIPVSLDHSLDLEKAHFFCLGYGVPPTYLPNQTNAQPYVAQVGLDPW